VGKLRPRPRLRRCVRFQPGVTFFKPAGLRMAQLPEAVLTFGEFEAVRLKDYENMEQVEASKKMRISQPTFNRLLRSARKKIADAIVNGKAIKIEGGNYKMVQMQGGGQGAGFGRGRGAGAGRGQGSGAGFQGSSSSCKCVNCGYESQKQRGVPCTQMKCPKCGSMMMRGK
jgi:predicted DNA-binding protein (UPF0251 family)